jgi:hypothetical protein
MNWVLLWAEEKLQYSSRKVEKRGKKERRNAHVTIATDYPMYVRLEKSYTTDSRSGKREKRGKRA